jgi:hypothetical protein
MIEIAVLLNKKLCKISVFLITSFLHDLTLTGTIKIAGHFVFVYLPSS